MAVERGTDAANISRRADGPVRATVPLRSGALDASTRRARRPRRANDRTTRERGSTSGCHWTPSAQRAAGQLDRLDEVVEHAPARRHDARRRARSTAWWWWDLVACSSSPAAAAGERAGRQAHVVVGVVEGARGAPVVGVADVVGQVLDQRPAAARR